MTVKELKEKAKSMGLSGYSKMRKAELEKFIEENTLHTSEVLFAGECSGDGEWFPVELKTGNSFTSYEWEREEVPNKYFAQVQQQLAVLGKNKGFLVGFVDNRFTRVYEIERNDKLISLAYELTKRFQKCLDENIEPELNGCPAECEFLKQEFQGFENKYEKIPLIKIEDKEMEAYFSMNDTKKLISKEIKDIDTDLDLTKAKIQKKMIELETESLLINGRYLATWKIDSRGAKRFNLKQLPEDKIIKEVA